MAEQPAWPWNWQIHESRTLTYYFSSATVIMFPGSWAAGGSSEAAGSSHSWVKPLSMQPAHLPLLIRPTNQAKQLCNCCQCLTSVEGLVCCRHNNICSSSISHYNFKPSQAKPAAGQHSHQISFNVVLYLLHESGKQPRCAEYDGSTARLVLGMS